MAEKGLKSKRKKHKILQSGLSESDAGRIKSSYTLNISLDYLISTSDISFPCTRKNQRATEISEDMIDKEFEKLKESVLKLIKNSVNMVNSAISKQTPALVTTAIVFPKDGSYFQCPNCKITMEREYQQYCDRCGQKLKWQSLQEIHYIYR